jgi:hypothetical protein
VKSGLPASNSDVVEAIQICEHSIDLRDMAGQLKHPSIVHLHIHALEMSDEPERSMKSADALSGLCPDTDHMNHMPGHIYVLCGEYGKAKHRQATTRYQPTTVISPIAGPLNYYTTACSHDLR